MHAIAMVAQCRRITKLSIAIVAFMPNAQMIGLLVSTESGCVLKLCTAFRTTALMRVYNRMHPQSLVCRELFATLVTLQRFSVVQPSMHAQIHFVQVGFVAFGAFITRLRKSVRVHRLGHTVVQGRILTQFMEFVLKFMFFWERIKLDLTKII
jgi:hypothetical protein